jgi:hypothetical protein
MNPITQKLLMSSATVSTGTSALAISHATSPFVTVYPWAGGFGTKYADPATLPVSSANAVAFSPDGAALAVAHITSPRLTTYRWVGGATGFGGTPAGTPYTLASAPVGNAWGVAFSPDGGTLAVVHSVSPFISMYPWSSATGYGTKYSGPNPSPAIFGTPNAVTFTQNSADVAIASSSTKYISVYPWSATFGGGYSDPVAIPSGVSTGVSFKIIS